MVVDKVAQGKKNRKSGSKTEAQVRAELEAQGYIVCRWQNNVQLDTDYDAGGSITIGKLVGAKPKYNPFKKMLMYSNVGFPDFLVIKRLGHMPKGPKFNYWIYSNIMIESKRNGYLDPEERQKAQWLLDNNICNKFITAKKTKEGHIIYTDFKTKEEIAVNCLFE
jgi:hypothetical protein